MSVSSVNSGLLTALENRPTKEAANNTLQLNVSVKSADKGLNQDTTKDASEIKQNTVVEKFLEYVNMDPIERLRASYLEEQGLSEDTIAELPAEEREKIEEAIRQHIKQKLTGDPSNSRGKVLDVTV